MRRRTFLKRCAAAAAGLAVPYVLPSGVLAQTPPSEATVRAIIGVGGMGNAHLGRLIERWETQRDIRIAALCDVDANHLGAAVSRARQAGIECDGYADYRDVLDRSDIDVVYIVTPPHWHALIAVHAAQAGKDIYCEKPMTKFIGEGRAVVDAVRRYGRVFHIGTFGRYGAAGLRRLFLARAFGDTVLIRMNQRRYNWKVREWSGRTELQPENPPPNLDWNMWLGPAPLKPYHPHRCHASFRGYWDYDGGGFTDMGAHYFDPIFYAIGVDGSEGADNMGPVRVSADAPWPAHPDAVGMWSSITYRFGNGITVRCNSGEWGESDPEDAPYIEGPRGKILADDRTDPPDLYDRAREAPDPPPMVDFETALRTRQQPGGNAEVSHRVASLMHAGNLAIRLGRELVWDPATESFVGDEEANRFVNLPMRAPWHL